MPEYKMMSKTVLWILVFAALVVVVYTGSDIIKAISAPIPPELSEDQIKPLDPTLNLSLIESLEKRVSFSNEDLSRISQERKINFAGNTPAVSPAASAGAQIR